MFILVVRNTMACRVTGGIPFIKPADICRCTIFCLIDAMAEREFIFIALWAIIIANVVFIIVRSAGNAVFAEPMDHNCLIISVANAAALADRVELWSRICTRFSDWTGLWIFAGA